MSDPKFTPGPWSVGEATGHFNQVSINPSIGCAYGAGEEVKANARLIAAAPKLFEALKGMLEVYGVSEQHLTGGSSVNSAEVELCNMARAALAEATGA